jgi:hypothetical protein
MFLHFNFVRDRKLSLGEATKCATWHDPAILFQYSLGRCIAFILGRPKVSSQLFLLVRERCLDIPKINSFVPAILAEVRNVSFGVKSHLVRIGPV